MKKFGHLPSGGGEIDGRIADENSVKETLLCWKVRTTTLIVHRRYFAAVRWCAWLACHDHGML